MHPRRFAEPPGLSSLSLSRGRLIFARGLVKQVRQKAAAARFALIASETFKSRREDGNC